MISTVSEPKNDLILWQTNSWNLPQKLMLKKILREQKKRRVKFWGILYHQNKTKKNNWDFIDITTKIRWHRYIFDHLLDTLLRGRKKRFKNKNCTINTIKMSNNSGYSQLWSGSYFPIFALLNCGLNHSSNSSCFSELPMRAFTYYLLPINYWKSVFLMAT